MVKARHIAASLRLWGIPKPGELEPRTKWEKANADRLGELSMKTGRVSPLD